MNHRLSATQIDEIFDAAEHVDVPVTQLLDAAAEIRAALLGSSDDVMLDLTQLSAHDVAPPRVAGLRRARIVRTTLVAAALSLALMISSAVSGALPDRLQHPLSRAAHLFGVNVPAEPAPAGAASNGTHLPPGGEATTAAPRANGPADAPWRTGAASTSSAVVSSVDQTVKTTPTTTSSGPPEVRGTPGGTAPVALPDAGEAANASKGNGNGPPEIPGTPNGNGPPEIPGTPNGNGRPEIPGTPNGNGPPEIPGTSNGNAYGHDK
jgi:hypothetical protein